MILIVFLFGIYLSLSYYALAKSNIHELIVACLESETNLYPPKLAQFYMYNFRGNKDDLEYLQKHNGLGFIFSSTSKHRDTLFQYASFFLEKGLNINTVGFDGFTALHGAILANQPTDVSFLLNNGADINVRVGYSRIYGANEKTSLFGMDAIELASHLAKNDKQDRSMIVEMLTK